jgi:hypothetical protein
VFHRTEIETVLEVIDGKDYRLEPAGEDASGRPLVTVYTRDPSPRLLEEGWRFDLADDFLSQIAEVVRQVLNEPPERR